MSHSSEQSQSSKGIWVNTLMIAIFIILVSFACWLVWVTYLRDHYDAGVIEISYEDGMIDVKQAPAAGTRNLRFHNTRDGEVGVESTSACVTCHTEHPHAASKSIRAYLNSHAYVMTCDVCHLKVDGSLDLTYRWLDRKKNVLVKSRSGEGSFKIIPIADNDGELRRFDQSDNLPAARDFVKKRDGMSDAFKKAIVNETHVRVRQEATSCSQCHNLYEEPVMSYEDLAYPSDRIDELRRLEVAGMVQKYEDFYMPSLIRESDIEQ